MYENFQITCTGVDILQFNDTKHAELPEKLKKKSHHRNLLIPKIIYSLFPKMKFDEYLNLTKDAVFNSKTTQVCENCYLDITKYCDNASNTENLLRTIGPFHGNIYHTSARKPLTASNFNNLNFNKNKSNNNILNVYLENEKIQKALNKNEKTVTSHQKSRSEHFLTKKVDHFEKVQSSERKLGEKALPVIKFNNKIMNKVIKRNNHLNISHLTELTDISDANNYKNVQALSKNKYDNN